MNDAYQEGYEAFKQGQTANPYTGDADRQTKWDEGWENAKMDAGVKRRAMCSEREADPS